MAKLVLFQTDGSTQDVPLTQARMTIGRRLDNDLCLPNLAVSGEHAAVVTIMADSFLEDLGSTNGTLVNGRAITKHFLRERDEIDVGKHRLVYLSDDATNLPLDIVSGSLRAAAGDLGNMVEHARPKSKPASNVVVNNGGAPAPRARAGGMQRTGNGHIDATAKIRAAPVKPANGHAPAAAAIASLKVLAGAHVGKSIALTKQQTTIGRAGVQVGVIVQTGLTFELRPVAGEVPPLVNGTSLAPEGIVLLTGDAIDVAGSRLEFAGSPPKAQN